MGMAVCDELREMLALAQASAESGNTGVTEFYLAEIRCSYPTVPEENLRAIERTAYRARTADALQEAVLAAVGADLDVAYYWRGQAVQYAQQAAVGIEHGLRAVDAFLHDVEEARACAST